MAWTRRSDCSLRSAFGPLLRNVLVGCAAKSQRTRACAGGFADRCLRPLGYVEMRWHRTTESNREPSALEAAALPVELGPVHAIGGLAPLRHRPQATGLGASEAAAFSTQRVSNNALWPVAARPEG
jgi:hypothetical protein